MRSFGVRKILPWETARGRRRSKTGRFVGQRGRFALQNGLVGNATEHVLQCRMPSFALQNAAFHTASGRHSALRKPSFRGTESGKTGSDFRSFVQSLVFQRLTNRGDFRAIFRQNISRRRMVQAFGSYGTSREAQLTFVNPRYFPSENGRRPQPDITPHFRANAAVNPTKAPIPLPHCRKMRNFAPYN